jgi:hypothetical protein
LKKTKNGLGYNLGDFLQILFITLEGANKMSSPYIGAIITPWVAVEN